MNNEIVILDGVDSYEALLNAEKHGAIIQLCSVGDFEEWTDFRDRQKLIGGTLGDFPANRYRAVIRRPVRAQGAEPVANNRKEFWKKLQSFVGDYIDGYEYCGEGDYAPNENEKFLIVDCVAGLLHELDSEGYFRAQPAKVPEFKFDEWWDQKARYIDHRSTKALARAAYKAGFGETYSGTTPQPKSAGVPEWAEELKKLAETATPGPWHGGHGACLDAVAVDYRDEIGNTAPESFTKIGGHAKMICKAKSTGWRNISQVVHDMKYIAAANPEAVLALVNLLTTTPQPADGGCLCQGCGNRYQFDVIVDDETWERIKPPKKAAGGGLLCPNCIANRVHQVGTGLWSAGYLSPIEQISPQPPREQGGE
jgi:hypothetical protein